jgi:nitroreductase
MRRIKQKIRNALPQKVLYWYYLGSAVKAVMPDLQRRVRDKVYNNSRGERVKRDLTLAYHIIEKGLTMPEPRPGFGKAIVVGLCKTIFDYDALALPQDVLEFRQSVSVLKEYRQFHAEIGFELDEIVANMLNEIESKYKNLEGEKQIRITRKDFFKAVDKPFNEFCFSRFSARNYTNRIIPLEVLHECIDLAQKSPSFCNRQPTRVYIVKSPEKKQEILSLQNGNRGFGHLAETLLILTSVISTTKDIHERNENHLNGGMFAMTLLNALHWKQIAACSLNWSVSNHQDQKLRKTLVVPENEVALMIISCGYPPDEFSIARSPRKKWKEITTEQL